MITVYLEESERSNVCHFTAANGIPFSDEEGTTEGNWIKIFKALWPLSDTAKEKLRIIKASNDKIIARKETVQTWDEAGWDMKDFLFKRGCNTVGCALGNAAEDLGLQPYISPRGFYRLAPPVHSFTGPEMLKFLDIQDPLYDFLFLGSKYPLHPSVTVTPHHVNHRIVQLLGESQ